MFWMRGCEERCIAMTAALAALCVVAACTGSAWAGEYHVYGCRMPDGTAAPTDGWSSSKAGLFSYAENGCNEGKALLAALGDGGVHAANTDAATWMFSTPPDDALVGATLWRAGDADGGVGTNATYEFWLTGPSETEVFDECVYEFGCQFGLGEPSRPLSNSNRVVVSASNLGSNLYVHASCGGVTTYKCPSGKGDSNGYAAVVYLYAADLTLEQSSQPTVSNVSGELATASSLSGTADLSFHAADSGSGVYQAVFIIDGTETGRTTLDANGGRCNDVGQTSDGLPAFLYLQPCAASLDADVPFDTTTLSDGTHHLVVSVTNAAGVSTVALDRKIAVLNHPLPPTPPSHETPSQPSSGGQGPAPTTKNEQLIQINPAPQLQLAGSTPATVGATLQVRWATTAHSSLSGAYGRPHTALGRLSTTLGAPIAGARVQVFSTPRLQGAHTLALAATTTAADGSFRVRIPASVPSSQLTFAYTSHPSSPVPDAVAALTLTVPAHLTLRVTPRTSHIGGTIAFAGTLSGVPLPPGGKQLILEARTLHGPWHQFRVLSTASRGRFRATYRFRLSGPITYEFRALSPREADFPYGTGSSAVVLVHER
jgi:hypothetical protein